MLKETVIATKNLSNEDMKYIDDKFYIENIYYISKKLGVSIFDVWNYAESKGYTSYLTDKALIDKVCSLSKSMGVKDIDVNDIANEVGVPSNCVKNILRRSGILKMRKWEEYEVDIMNEYYGQSSVKELEKVLFLRTKQSINKKASLLGLTKEGFKAWTEEELNFVKEHYGEIPVSEIAKTLDRSESAITIIAVKVGKSIKGKNHKYTDEDIALVKKYMDKKSVAEMHRLFFSDVSYSSFNYFCKKVKGEYVPKRNKSM